MTQQGHAAFGPLHGLRVLEFASIGPGPHCGMLLADLGAEVVRIERKDGDDWRDPNVERGRSRVTVDIRTLEGRDYCRAAARDADVLIEGFRPGVMEARGLGPEILLGENPRLIYGRVTGWGQQGPLAKTAGHDINYIALTGALAAIGAPDRPAVPPLNLVGDFGGGSLFLAFGILAALWERERSGRGQVVDAAIIDGVNSLMSMFANAAVSPLGSLDRARNLLGGAAPFYRCYVCKDGKEIAVGPLEPKFYAEFLQRIDAPAELREAQNSRDNWPERGALLTKLFLTRTRSEWQTLLEGSDACFAPVLDLDEVPHHPHMRARHSHFERDGQWHPAPAPRFSRTPGAARPSQPDGDAVLRRWRGT